MAVTGFTVPLPPRVVLRPTFAATMSTLAQRFPEPHNVSVSAASTLVLDGPGVVTIHSLHLDGCVVIRAAAGATVGTPCERPVHASASSDDVGGGLGVAVRLPGWGFGGRYLLLCLCHHGSVLLTVWLALLVFVCVVPVQTLCTLTSPTRAGPSWTRRATMRPRHKSAASHFVKKSVWSWYSHPATTSSTTVLAVRAAAPV